MKEAGVPNSAPQVHLYKDIKEVDASHLLLIVDKDGNKYSLNASVILELMDEIKELKAQVKKLEKKGTKLPTKRDIVNLLSEDGVIVFPKPISLFGNKVNEKRITKIGVTYNNGKELRTLTETGWKSSIK